MKPVPAYTDPLLADLLKQKDPAACHFLYEKYAGALYGLIDQILPGSKNNNELLGQAFTRIIDSINEYDASRGRLFTWMMQLVRQLAIDQLKAGSQQEVPGMDPLHKDSRGVKGLIAKLQGDEQQVICLIYLKGYSIDEIARQLGIPPEIVKIKINKGLVAIHSAV